MKDELRINVVGKTASGKSTVIYLMKEFLREKGFDVEFDGGVDFDTEEQFNYHIGGEINRMIQVVNEKSKLVINEVQAEIE